MNQNNNTWPKNNSLLDSDNDFHWGFQMISHNHRQQSFLGLLPQCIWFTSLMIHLIMYSCKVHDQMLLLCSNPLLYLLINYDVFLLGFSGIQLLVQCSQPVFFRCYSQGILSGWFVICFCYGAWCRCQTCLYHLLIHQTLGAVGHSVHDS